MISLLELYEQIRKLVPEDELVSLSSENLIGLVFEKSCGVDWNEVFKQDVADGPEVSEESCLKIRDAGTKFFQNNKLLEAIKSYNDYLRSCHRLKDSELKLRLLHQG